jgi:pyruvate kinase
MTARSVCGSSCGEDHRRLHGRGRRDDLEPQGRERARRGAAARRADREGPQAIWIRLQLGVDWLALSFVQRPEDVIEARALAAGRAAILSKIEKPAAVRAFDEILAVSDGIMVARGDLGVELPVQNVPPIQKRLVRKLPARESR